LIRRGVASIKIQQMMITSAITGVVAARKIYILRE
jgi:hypothetical protein